MRLPIWYRLVLAVWLLVIVPFWWFAMAFNGQSFFSLPVFASPSGGDGWQVALIFQILVCLAMAAPVLGLPFVIFSDRRTEL